MADPKRVSKYAIHNHAIGAFMRSNPQRAWRVGEVAHGTGLPHEVTYTVLYLNPHLYERTGTVGRFRLRPERRRA